jgi:hypothetical protein
MARKSRYDQLLAAIDRARKPAPLDDPLPKRMPSHMTRPVFNANWTRCFEEDITNIYPGPNQGQWRGTVVESLGRKGTVQVWWNSTRQCWQYA